MNSNFNTPNVKQAVPFFMVVDMQLKDPDGYNVHFESPTEVPEETLYSDWVKKGGK